MADIQDDDSSMPSLVGSESDTDSDEEDYRQLEETPCGVTASISSPDAPLSSLAAANSGDTHDDGSRVSQIQQSFRPRSSNDGEDSEDSMPPLVASSSSASDDSVDSDDEDSGRNVRPRHAANPSQTNHPSAPLRREEGNSRQLYPQYASHTLAYGTAARNETNANASDRPFGFSVASRRETASRINLRGRNNYQNYWNSELSAALQRAPLHAPAAPRATPPGVPTGAFVQVIGGNALWEPVGEVGGHDEVMFQRAEIAGSLPTWLSSLLGAQGIRLEGTSEGFADIRDLPLDPILQVLQASFNLPPQRKPQVSKQALETVMLVRMSSDDAETVCPISAEALREGEWAARMPCGHYFGKNDLFEWLRVNNSCPVCRFELPTDDLQYNQQHDLSLDEVSKTAAAACGAVDDIIGKRMCSAREAVLDDMMDESWSDLGVHGEGWTFSHDAALAAEKREALQRYYALEQSATDLNTPRVGCEESVRQAQPALGQQQQEQAIVKLYFQLQADHAKCNSCNNSPVGGYDGAETTGVGAGCEEEDVLFEEALVQLLLARQGELQDNAARDASNCEPDICPPPSDIDDLHQPLDHKDSSRWTSVH